MIMLFVSLIKWWYTDGWRQRAKLISVRLDGVIDYFSVDLLLKTLFSPFRQISAGRVDGPLGDQLRAFADRLVSRLIGAVVRTLILLVGLVAISVYAVGGLVILVLWLFVPLLPIVGTVLAASGWAI